jgi:gliding motility-associated lipoprotein GldD
VKNETQFGKKIDERCWLNLEFESLNGTLYLSYKDISENQDLDKLLGDTDYMAYKMHTQKADYINQYPIAFNDKKVYGLYYALGGNTASTIQFYLTDSTSQFVHGSLYFNSRPNFDSIKPILKFLETDIDHFIKSFRLVSPTS